MNCKTKDKVSFTFVYGKPKMPIIKLERNTVSLKPIFYFRVFPYLTFRFVFNFTNSDCGEYFP